jgi:hypothetical protein
VDRGFGIFCGNCHGNNVEENVVMSSS